MRTPPALLIALLTATPLSAASLVGSWTCDAEQTSPPGGDGLHTVRVELVFHETGELDQVFSYTSKYSEIDFTTTVTAITRETWVLDSTTLTTEVQDVIEVTLTSEPKMPAGPVIKQLTQDLKTQEPFSTGLTFLDENTFQAPFGPGDLTCRREN